MLCMLIIILILWCWADQCHIEEKERKEIARAISREAEERTNHAA